MSETSITGLAVRSGFWPAIGILWLFCIVTHLFFAVVPHYALEGPELVANGGFDAGLTGWTSRPRDAPVPQGAMVLTNDPAAGPYAIYQSFVRPDTRFVFMSVVLEVLDDAGPMPIRADLYSRAVADARFDWLAVVIRRPAVSGKHMAARYLELPSAATELQVEAEIARRSMRQAAVLDVSVRAARQYDYVQPVRQVLLVSWGVLLAIVLAAVVLAGYWLELALTSLAAFGLLLLPLDWKNVFVAFFERHHLTGMDHFLPFLAIAMVVFARACDQRTLIAALTAAVVLEVLQHFADYREALPSDALFNLAAVLVSYALMSWWHQQRMAAGADG